VLIGWPIYFLPSPGSGYAVAWCRPSSDSLASPVRRVET
jgi:hypothetical protein